MEENKMKMPSLGLALFAFAGVAGIISYGILGLGQDAHIPIVFAAFFAAVVGKFALKRSWGDMESSVMDTIFSALQALLVLLVIGMLVGIWIRSGIVPGLIYYGFNLLSPGFFLLASLLISSIVAIATGSSWGASGTVGIALMGIAAGLGVPAPVAAGVIVSGAYFGDKMSPLSDTTNLAPAVSGSNLFDHIRAMVWTTGPTYLIVGVITVVLGMKYASGSLDVMHIKAIQAVMSKEFVINLGCFVPPLIVIVLAAMKMPAVPGLFSGVLAGAAFALFQGVSVGDIIGAIHYGYEPALSANLAGADLGGIAGILAENGLSIAAESAQSAGVVLADLLARGGMDSMMWSLSLIMVALCLGGIMESCGYLQVILTHMLKGVRTAGGLVSLVMASSLASNLFLGDQYLAIVVPGRMFKSAFDETGLAPRMLSRTLEDCGTLTSALVPWTGCGAFQAGALGVPTFAYLPYAFLNYLNPLVAILMTYLGIGVYWGKNGEDKVERRTAIEFVK